jgi:thiamine biosynthesis lipoprotein
MTGVDSVMRKIIYPLIFSVLMLSSCVRTPQQEIAYIKNSGKMHGTFYHATYQHPEGKDLQLAIEQKMKEFELSLSTFHPNSIISRINNNDDSVVTDEYFESMYAEARKVSENSAGAFDITVAPLVNAWGFGFGDQDRTAAPDVKTILGYTGFKKIKLEHKKIIKSDQRIMLDASAIAKGQSSDIIGKLLESHGCENYMIEIGGEVACKGVNPSGKKWQIGIDKPVDSPFDNDDELQTIVAISGVGLATSGNYRQFYYKDGKKYAHTINPKTGYPVDHNLLSATVIAPSCMQADAYATAFMVLGVEGSLNLCKRIPGLECYLIYVDDNGSNQVVYSDGFKKYFAE